METLPYGPRLGRSSLRKLQSPADPVSQRQSHLSFLPLSGSVQFSSVTQSCPTLCDPVDFPVIHYLLEFA